MCPGLSWSMAAGFHVQIGPDREGGRTVRKPVEAPWPTSRRHGECQGHVMRAQRMGASRGFFRKHSLSHWPAFCVAEAKEPTGRAPGSVTHPLSGSCAPPVFPTLAQVLQVVSPAPQEHPKDSRMNSPFQMWKLERAPGLSAQAVSCRGKLGVWAGDVRSSNYWAALCLIYSEQKLATCTTPWSPQHYFPWPMCTLQSSLDSPISPLSLQPGPGTLSPLLRAGEAIVRLIYGLPLMPCVHLSCASVHVWRPCGLPTSSESAAMSSQRLLCNDDRSPGPWYAVSLQ